MALRIERDGESTGVDSSQAFQSATFDKDGSVYLNEAVGAASISPGGRDVVLASRQGLHILDLENPYSPPRFLPHHTSWEVADVQWSPFASRDYWIVSTSNQKALVWNLELSNGQIPIEHVLHAHTRAITDINFSAHEPDFLATCAVDSFIHCWDLRQPWAPVLSFAEWIAGATQVKWNRQNPNILASSHDQALYIWDRRNTARPLRLVDAHATKIYGIDWSRRVATELLTCSSDKTIKLWDYEDTESPAKNIIRTSYPVWRARHTPFGSGVLAMPQRGNNSLYLYNQQDAQGTDGDVPSRPVHIFDGHEDQVKEFLWRVRHGTDEGKDDRSFQLVSWGSDRNLMLHRVDDALLDTVGFQRGKPVDGRLQFTRKGATYRTFNNEKQTMTLSTRSPAPPVQGLISIYRDGNKYDSRPVSKASPLLPPSQHGMRVRSGDKRSPNAIAWMKGVKLVNTKDDSNSMRESMSHLTLSSTTPWDTREGLGDEIACAGDKYKNVAFEEVDVPARIVTLSLSGPWGPEDVLVHLKTTVYFPTDYPDGGAPYFAIEKTSSISDAAFTKLKVELKTLCEAYSSIGRGCLEAILCYLLGEQTLLGSIQWITESKPLDASEDLRIDESSSDEEDDVIGVPYGELNMSNCRPGLINPVISNANVPLPKGCGAIWSQDGRLVCFFPAKEELKSSIERLDPTLVDKHSNTLDMFEGFGRLHVQPLQSNRGRLRSISVGSSDSSESSDFSSFSGSSDAASDFDPSFRAGLPWGGTSNRTKPIRSLDRSVDHSNRSASKPLLKIDALKPKTIVSIQTQAHVVPSSKALAEEYWVFGSGPSVCSHNAEVAQKHGFHDICDAWKLVELILCNEVPLSIWHQAHSAEEILVLARGALVHIKRKDSGIDLAFDRPPDVVNAKLRGHVKWGQHPFAGSWLIDVLFEHFENLADVQMLAMLSCVLSQPATIDGASKAIRHLSTRELPMALKAPGFSLDYFSSTEVARSHYEPEEAITIAREYPEAPNDAFGSFTSSNDFWSSDTTQYDEHTSQSTDISPPQLTPHNSRGSNAFYSTSLSSSPEQEMKRSNSINTFAASYRSLLFGLSSSPPTHRSQPPPQLSSSAPNTGPLNANGVSWGRNTIYEDNASLRHIDSYSSAIYDDEYEAGADFPPEEDEEVFTTLKNQNMFDDEACHSAPILRPTDSFKHRAYREAYASLLDIWDLPIQRCEILKFNGLTLQSPETTTTTESESPFEICKSKAVAHDVPACTEMPYHQGLNMAGTCRNCGEVMLLQPFTNQLPQCSNCQKVQNRLTCSICYETTRGLYKPCLTCGHAVHIECQEQWLSSGAAENYRECETGCGCDCSEFWMVDADELMGSDAELESLGGEVGTTETETETETLTTVWEWPRSAGWDNVTGAMRGGVVGDRTSGEFGGE